MKRLVIFVLSSKKEATMNAAEIHLALNHLPISATLFGILVLIGGFLFKSEAVRKTGLILLIAAGLFTIPAVSTGEEAEEIVEHMGLEDDIRDYIHEHEELAETAQWISLGVGFLALLAFYFTHTKKAPARILSILALIAALGSMGFLGNVASKGGEIRHSESREGFIDPDDGHDEK